MDSFTFVAGDGWSPSGGKQVNKEPEFASFSDGKDVSGGRLMEHSGLRT
jgi:hypothetical protein